MELAFMLPGLRFLFAAIALSMSILVFGLGAAALLRAAHEEVASSPSWRVTPETQFAQQNEATRPVLAMLRLEPSAEQKAPEPVAAVDAPAEPAAIATMPAEPERIAALKPEVSPPAEAATPEIAVQESPAQNNAGIAVADTPAPAGETRVAATEQTIPPANEAAPAASEQASTPISQDNDIASTKIATLGGPPVTIEPMAKRSSATPDQSAVKKRQQARRAAHRRRIALRARTAQQTPQQPAAEPFNQPTITVRGR
jgi:hypothetical protein